MKKYPSIPSKILYDVPVAIYQKVDGSQVRVAWNSQRGFYKFGSRNGLISTKDPILGKIPNIFMDKYSKDLSKVFKKNGWTQAVAFCEFWGPNSFAGTHNINDKHTVTLFDIYVEKRGFLFPDEFSLISYRVEETPEVLALTTTITTHLETRIRNNLVWGDTHAEGVVCKSVTSNLGRPIMFKIKTDQWIRRLYTYCKGNYRRFYELI